jgi:hypothetical protein
MAYEAPTGWIESLPAPADVRPLTRFHSRKDCPAIKRPAQLEYTDRPYSAKRCLACAQR